MKPEKIKHRFYSRLSLKETWVIFFILGIIMMNYPFLDIFNKNSSIAGIPLFYIYIIGGWAISIIVIFFFTRSINTANGDNQGPEKR